MSNLFTNIGFTRLKKFKQPKKSSVLLSLEETKDIGIVYDAKRVSEYYLQKMVNQFEKEGKTVVTLGFVNDKALDPKYEKSYKHDFYCNQDLGIWKTPKLKTIQKFVQTPFDYLINLDTTGSLQMQAVSVYSKGKTRVGKHFDRYAFAHELMVKSVAENEEDLFQEIIKYIK